MSRLNQLLTAARHGLARFEPIPESLLHGIADALGPKEIADLLAELDRLSQTFEALPGWDGDAQDGVSDAQALLSRLVGLLPPASRPEAEQGLLSPLPRTRVWVALGLEAHGAAALPALRAALARESEGHAREMLAGAVERLGGR